MAAALHGGNSEDAARGGGGSGCGDDGDSGGTQSCSDGSGDDNLTPSSTFLEQSLERQFTPFFLQMTARVCGGGIPSPLIEPKMGREGKGPT